MSEIETIPTPELDKLAKENWKTELVHEFLEFARDKGYVLASYGWLEELVPVSNEDSLLAEFIGVDMKKVAAEKELLLNKLRELNA